MIRSVLLSSLLVAPALSQGTLERIEPALVGEFPELLDLSGDGRVFVGYEFSGAASSFYLFRDGVYEIVPAMLGSISSLRLSEDGRVVCGSANKGFTQTPFSWTVGGDVQELTLPPGTDSVVLSAINANGSVIAGYVPSYSPRAMRWINGAPSLLTVPDGGDSFIPYDISPDGWTMVGAGVLSSVKSAARWTEAGGLTLLDLPAGFMSGRALSQSAESRVVVGSVRNHSYTDFAALWNEHDEYLDLHDPAWQYSHALKVDRSGSRVLIVAKTVWGEQGFVYDVATATYLDLSTVLAESGGPDLFAHHLIDPRAMSADGNTFIGEYLGVPLQFDRWFWRVDVNSFGQKVCGPAARNSSGSRASLLGSGSLSVSDGSARLTATLLPVGSLGMMLASRTMAISRLPGSSGVLCVGGQVGRFQGPQQVQISDYSGTLHVDIDLCSLPLPNSTVAALPGETWFFQTWFRDSGFQTANATDALRVTLTQ